MACTREVLKKGRNSGDLFFLPLFQPARVSRFRVSHDHGTGTGCCTAYFNRNFIKRRFETKLIASEALCSVRAVLGIRLKRQQFEMPTPRTNGVGRRSCITSPMQKALCDLLIKQPYLYRCEMADFLYRRFRKRISARSIGRALRSVGWTRTTIHRIAQTKSMAPRNQ